MEDNKGKCGKYRSDSWEVNSFSENMQRYTAELFDMIEEYNFSDPKDFIKHYFDKARREGKERYMSNHFEDFALAIEAEMCRRKEDIEIDKLRNAKTGQTITIGKSYGAIIDSRDSGRRFIRKKDAEEYLRGLRNKY